MPAEHSHSDHLAASTNKSISKKPQRARQRQADTLVADLQRRARARSSTVKQADLMKAAPASPRLQIMVHDKEDWYDFITGLLEWGWQTWLDQGDRLVRGRAHDASIPWFTSKKAFREALRRVADRYWDRNGALLRRHPGRPSDFTQCQQALWRALRQGGAAGRITYRASDMVPCLNGHPLTRDEVCRLIQTGKPGVGQQVLRKYGRLLHLFLTTRDYDTLPKSDLAFFEKHYPTMRGRFDLS